MVRTPVRACFPLCLHGSLGTSVCEECSMRDSNVWSDVQRRFILLFVRHCDLSLVVAHCRPLSPIVVLVSFPSVAFSRGRGFRAAYETAMVAVSLADNELQRWVVGTHW